MNALNNPFQHDEHAHTVSLFKIKLFVLVRMCLKISRSHSQITVLHHSPVDYYFNSAFLVSKENCIRAIYYRKSVCCPF